MSLSKTQEEDVSAALPKTHDVVLRTKDGNCRVVPGFLIARTIDSVVFHAQNADFKISFPDGSPFDEPDLNLEEGKKKKLKITRGIEIYKYTVTCTSSAMPNCVGGSDPEIIIYE